jgi:hypothetical protein
VRSGWSHGVHDPDPLLAGDHSDFDEVAGGVGPEEQRDIVVLLVDVDPVAQCVANVVVMDTMTAGRWQ